MHQQCTTVHRGSPPRTTVHQQRATVHQQCTTVYQRFTTAHQQRSTVHQQRTTVHQHWPNTSTPCLYSGHYLQPAQLGG